MSDSTTNPGEGASADDPRRQLPGPPPIQPTPQSGHPSPSAWSAPGRPPAPNPYVNVNASAAPPSAPAAWTYGASTLPPAGAQAPYGAPPAPRNTWVAPVLIGFGVLSVVAVVAFVSVLLFAAIAANTAKSIADSVIPSPPPGPSDYSAPGAGPLDPGDTNAPSVCGLTEVSMSGTLTTGPAASWASIHGMSAPTIEGQGPGERSASGYRSCFARTPTGALLAAANGFVIDGAGVDARRDFCTDGMVKGPGQILALLKSYKREDSDGTVQIVGFMMENYDGYVSDIELALRADDGWTGAVDAKMMWSDGDWKLVVDSDGGYFYEVDDPADADDFVQWSPPGLAGSPGKSSPPGSGQQA